MPFSTDNSWPVGLLRIFEICREENKPYESRYYGPYTKLLDYCFGNSFTFVVVLKKTPSNCVPEEAADPIFSLTVFDAAYRPVLMVEIKDDDWASIANNRLQADEQLRDQYNAMLDTCPLPRFWGLSLLGTSARIYCGDVAARTITPWYQARPREDYILPLEFLKGEWDLDILSQEGFNKMKEIVMDIMTAAAVL